MRAVKQEEAPWPHSAPQDSSQDVRQPVSSSLTPSRVKPRDETWMYMMALFFLLAELEKYQQGTLAPFPAPQNKGHFLI